MCSPFGIAMSASAPPQVNYYALFVKFSRDPASLVVLIVKSRRFKQLRDLLAFVALVKYGGKLFNLLTDYGFVGLALEIYESIKKRVFKFARSAPVIGGPRLAPSTFLD